MSKYSSYILFLLITIFIIILSANDFGPMARLQQSVNDLICRLTATDQTHPNVVLVKIDGRAQDEFGQWPWNHDIIADLLAATAHGKPKSIMVTFNISENAVQDSAGYTDVLAQQLSWIKNAILPYDIALSSFRSKRTNNPKHLFNYSLAVRSPLGLMDESSSLHARKVFLPADKLLDGDPKLGFEYVMPDDDKVLRHQALLVNYEGYYYPSLELMAAATYLGLSTDQVHVIEGESIELANYKIPIDDKSRYFIKHSGDNSFATYSASEVLGEDFDFNNIKNKLVVLCVDDFSQTQYYQTSGSDETADYIIKATVVDNLINGDVLELHNNSPVTDLLILFLLGGLCAYFLPQIVILHRIIMMAGGLVLVANANYFLISSFDMITNTVYIALELLLFMIVAPLLDSSLLTGEDKSKSIDRKKNAPRFTLDPSLPGFENIPMRELVSSPNDEENLNTAMIQDEPAPFHDPQAIDLDASSDTMATSAASEDVEGETSAFDSSAAIDKNKKSGRKRKSSGAREIINDDQLSQTPLGLGIAEPTNLGRYKILGTLGKGAMGHVYKGVDPAINRPVALKTIRLDFVNDPEEMEELKERLFREAQAAGKLSHPNIVTIYDVGNEGHLQYIAMEYLEGCTLEELIKKKTKFNYRIISQMIIQMCQALEYAHDRGIIHRDIKPANIMILSDYSVKIMDYGIARVDSSSMTKTGIAMGTPNYIAPEQLQSKDIDSRADLFSLGVVMYELLLGKRPFKGENITSLIYSILNTEPEKPSTVNPQVPLLMDHIIGKALKKNPAERYQKASEIMADLSDFVESFAIKR